MRRIRGLGVFGMTLAASLSLAACVVIHSSAISDRSGNGTAVSTETDDMGILRLTAPQDLTQRTNTALAAQCSSGKLTDIQTELAMRDFLIVQMYQLSAAGICQ